MAPKVAGALKAARVVLGEAEKAERAAMVA